LIAVFYVLQLTESCVLLVSGNTYSHIFEKFIDFIGIKSLIITDIDSEREFHEKDDQGKVKISIKKCPVEDTKADRTSNASLKFYFKANLSTLKSGQNSLDFFKALTFKAKLLSKIKGKWTHSEQGNVLVIYQVAEENSDKVNYHARSFEDAFFHLNRQFIIDKKTSFKSLKKIKYFDDTEYDPYILAEECVGKKPSFAMEILLNSKTDTGRNDFSNWETPLYIKEGLSWLKQN